MTPRKLYSHSGVWLAVLGERPGQLIFSQLKKLRLRDVATHSKLTALSVSKYTEDLPSVWPDQVQHPPQSFMPTFVIIYWDDQNVSLGFSCKMVQNQTDVLANPTLPCVALRWSTRWPVWELPLVTTLTERPQAAADTPSVAITPFNQLEKLTWMRITVLMRTRHPFFSITLNSAKANHKISFFCVNHQSFIG